MLSSYKNMMEIKRFADVYCKSDEALIGLKSFWYTSEWSVYTWNDGSSENAALICGSKDTRRQFELRNFYQPNTACWNIWAVHAAAMATEILQGKA